MTNGLLKAAGLLLLAGTIALGGCAGSNGKDGAPGANGVNGNDGNDGNDGATGPQGPSGAGLGVPAKQSVFVSNLVFGTDASNQLTATFDVASGVTTGRTPVTGLARTAFNLYVTGNLPGANGDADQWNIWVNGAASTATENPAGHYVITTNKTPADVAANTTTQRGYVRVTATGLIGGLAGYDFALTAPGTPVATASEIVNDASCKDCHGFGVTIHSFARNNTRFCVVCHSPGYSATIAPHGADMVTMVHQIHQVDPSPVVTGFTPDTLGTTTAAGNGHWADHGENWATLKYPGNMLDCAKCHNTVVNADNWKTRPTQRACKSCHKSIDFSGGAYFGIKRGTGFIHNYANNSMCASCHAPGAQYDVEVLHSAAAKYDASKRTLEASITGATIDANGVVTVSFTLTDAGTPVTDPTFAFTGLNFTLTKLVPGVGDAPSRWQSYLSKARTKVASAPPVVQGRNEAYPGDGGTVTQVGTTNEYIYQFALLNGSTQGDISTIEHVHNSSKGIGGSFDPSVIPTLRYPVPYEPTLTHRIAMAVSRKSDGIANKTNAFYDFVPAGGAPTTTRNIVSRQACDKCHGPAQLHAGFAIEYCVGCHNQNSYDPYSGRVEDVPNVTSPASTAPFGTSSVALERVVHKIHMGRGLTYGYTLNGASHDFSDVQYPGGVPSDTGTPKPRDCRMCHDEKNAAMTDAASWKVANRACGSCHDTIAAQAHIAANTYDPTPGPTPKFDKVSNGWVYSGDEIEACSICHAPGGLAPVDEAHFGVMP